MDRRKNSQSEGKYGFVIGIGYRALSAVGVIDFVFKYFVFLYL